MTFTLQSGNCTAVARSYGGELVSFIRDGHEYVWQGDPAFWNGQAPVLFPAVCATKDGKMAFDGVEYPVPKHGIARKREFVPVLISRDRVVLEQRESDETLKMFPFCYSLKIEHSITNSSFTTRYTVKNLDKNEMTFSLGGHPGFNVPVCDEDGGFEDHSLIFEDTAGATVSITKNGYMDPSVPQLDILKDTNVLPLKYSDYDNDALIIENLPKKSVKLVSNKTGHGILFIFEGYDALGIWTPDHKEAPFICLEPWNGVPAGVNETTDAKSRKYAITLKSGEEYTVEYTAEVI